MKLGCAALLLALGVALPRLAAAQVHTDLDAEAGIAAHILTKRPPGSPSNPTVGPSLELAARLALLPFVRAGAYVAHDFSPVPGADLRELTSAGVSLKAYSPWPRGALRAGLVLGFGYASAYAPSYANVSGTGGGFFEVPVRLGLTLRATKRLSLLFDLGARFGFGFSGSMYNQGPVAYAQGSFHSVPAPGEDSVALLALLGVAFEL